MSLVESGALIPSLYKQENYSNVYYRTDTLQISVGNSSSSNNLSFSISDSNNNTVTGMSMTIVPGGDYPTVQNFIFGYRYSCAIIENKSIGKSNPQSFRSLEINNKNRSVDSDHVVENKGLRRLCVR